MFDNKVIAQIQVVWMEVNMQFFTFENLKLKFIEVTEKLKTQNTIIDLHTHYKK